MKFIMIAIVMSVILSLSAFNYAFAGTGPSDDRDCLMMGQACLTPDMYVEESPNLMVKTSMEGSDTVKIFGTVNNMAHPIVIQVFAPNGNLITIDQVMSNSDHTFASTVKVGGPLYKQDGEYTILVQQNIKNSATTYNPEPNPYVALNDPGLSTHASFAETEQYGQTAYLTGNTWTNLNKETVIVTIVDGEVQDYFNKYFADLWWSIEGASYVAEIYINENSKSIVVDLVPVELPEGHVSVSNTMNSPSSSTVTGVAKADRDDIAVAHPERGTAGYFQISLPREVIDAKMCYDIRGEGDINPQSCTEWGPDTQFIVLVDGEESDYQEWPTAAQRKLEIPFNHGATQIEIIGTEVIPEFGTIAGLVLAVALISIIAVSAKTRLNIIPKF